MATAISIAIRNEQALVRLNEAAIAISEHVGVDAPDIPTEYRDANELPTMQLEAMADWTRRIAESLTKEQINVTT